MAAATFETDLIEIITQALEAAAIIGGLWSSFGIVELAQNYYNLYNQQRQFYYNAFQLGVEAPLAVAVYNIPLVVQDYLGTAAQLYAPTGVFGGEMGMTNNWWLRHGLMFGVAQAQSILDNEQVQDQALTESQWTNVMFRFSEVNFDLLSEQRWDHRMKLHNVALKQMSQVLGSLASSVELREDTMSDRASNFSAMANSLAQRRGIVQGHRDVQARYAALTSNSGTTYGVLKAPTPAGLSSAPPSKQQPYSASTYALNSPGAISRGQAIGQSISTVQ